MNHSEEINLWLSRIAENADVSQEDLAEMESHILDSIDDLKTTGLNEDEATIIALRRFGTENQLNSSFINHSTDKIWKDLFNRELIQDDESHSNKSSIRLLIGGLFLLIGLSSLIPTFMGISLDKSWVYPLNLSFMSIPFIALFYLGRKWIQQKEFDSINILFSILLLTPLIVNFYPYKTEVSQTGVLTLLHLPIASWILLSVFRNKEVFTSSDRRMEFIRYTGEALIYCILVGLSYLVLIGLSAGLFQILQINIESFFERFIFPLVLPITLFTGILLVEQKRSIIENFAPILAKIIGPLLLIVVTVFTLLLFSNNGLLKIDREYLILMDLLLLAVIMIVIYSLSTRSEFEQNTFQDWVNLFLVAFSIVSDVFILIIMIARLNEFGITPNRMAAIGANILLLGNLILLLSFYIQQIRTKTKLKPLLSMQGIYLGVYYLWMLIVALIFPLIFNFS